MDIAAVYQLLSRVANTVDEHAQGWTRLENRLEGGFTDLRQTLTQCNASVIGHGILISEPKHRVRWLEDYLNLPPLT